MDKKRYDTLLFNAIDLLLLNYDRKQICEELGMTNKEFGSVGDVPEESEATKEQVKRAKKAIGIIKRMREGAGRLAYEIVKTDFIKGEHDYLSLPYDGLGEDLLEVIDKHPDSIAAIEDTIIALTGYSFCTLQKRMKEHEKDWDNKNPNIPSC